MKQCREEGLLERDGNLIRVRVREAKSTAEMERYTVENCALEAKFIREKKLGSISGEERSDRHEEAACLEESMKAVKLQQEVSLSNQPLKEADDNEKSRSTKGDNLNKDSDESSDEEIIERPYQNPFCVGDSDSSCSSNED